MGTLDTSAASIALGGRFLLGGSPDYYLPGVGMVQGTGSPLIRGSLVDPAWRHFQPRIGLAYRPFGDNQTAIRAGFGTYYVLQDASSIAFELLSPPFNYQNLLVNTTLPAGQQLHDSQFWPWLHPPVSPRKATIRVIAIRGFTSGRPASSIRSATRCSFPRNISVITGPSSR